MYVSLSLDLCYLSALVDLCSSVYQSSTFVPLSACFVGNSHSSDKEGCGYRNNKHHHHNNNNDNDAKKMQCRNFYALLRMFSMDRSLTIHITIFNPSECNVSVQHSCYVMLKFVYNIGSGCSALLLKNEMVAPWAIPSLSLA